jgi:hypothetical protein
MAGSSERPGLTAVSSFLGGLPTRSGAVVDSGRGHWNACRLAGCREDIREQVRLVLRTSRRVVEAMVADGRRVLPLFRGQGAVLVLGTSAESVPARRPDTGLLLPAHLRRVNTAISIELRLRFLVELHRVAMAENQKVCFVTTGATAPFTGLIEAVLTPGCVDALSELGYTHLLIQYGTANDVFDRAASTARTHVGSQRQSQHLVIDGLDFNPHGLKEQFKLVQESKGLVISHAGTFGILQYLTQQLSDPQAPGRYWRPYDTTSRSS